MKTTITLILTLFISLTAFAQFPLEHTYDSDPIYNPVSDTEGVYHTFDTLGNLKFYDDNHQMVQSNVIPELGNFNNPSKYTVDSDDGIEFIHFYYDNAPVYRLIDDDGSIILQGTLMSLFQSADGAKLVVDNKVYTLPGDYKPLFGQDCPEGNDPNTGMELPGTNDYLLPAYPNPTGNTVYIPHSPGTLEIYNSNGQLVESRQMQRAGTHTYNTNIPGTYIYSINGRQQGKFVVQ